MSKVLGAKRWTAQVARQELEGLRRSGLSLARYAARRGYQAQRLSWWKQRLSGVEAPSRVALAPAVIARSSQSAVSVAVSADGEVRVEVSDAEAVHPAWLGELVRSMRREP